MKRFITILLVLCLALTVFVGCARQKDRAENNGVVTDDTSTGKDTAKATAKDTNNIIDDAGNAVSDAVEGATDAIDDMLGGDGTGDTSRDKDTSNRVG